jgi:Holliday junction resolvase
MSPINSRDKGDRGEREAIGVLWDHLGVKAFRLRTPGEGADRGDLGGVPNTTIEVKNRDSLTSSLAGLEQCERAQERNGHNFGATLIRRPGGRWMVVQTLPQFAALWREAQPTITATGTPISWQEFGELVRKTDGAA